MNRSASEGSKVSSDLSGPTDWTLRYIKNTLTFYLSALYISYHKMNCLNLHGRVKILSNVLQRMSICFMFFSTEMIVL